MSLFEKATREKFRFASTRGMITTEDLWDLTLEELNHTAVALNRQIKATQEETFLKKSKTDSRLESHLEVLVHVIQYKEAQEEARQLEALRKQELDKRLELIEQKRYQELAERSIEDLKSEYEELSSLNGEAFRERLSQL